MDADDDTRARYRKSLLSIGCDVIDAADGRDALVSALVHRPSLVITEAHLPIFDGYALCEILRRDSMTSTVPLLVVTTETRDAATKRARTAGADAVLLKPVPPDLLLSEIQRLLGDDAASVRRSERKVSPDRRALKAKIHSGTDPTTLPAPDLTCPSCDRPLTFERSHFGGVRAGTPERWDDFTCPGSCGTFKYRHRTRQLRQVHEPVARVRSATADTRTRPLRPIVDRNGDVIAWDRRRRGR